jgi:hypothetical protein
MVPWTKRTTEEASMARPHLGSMVAVISTILVLAGCGDEQPDASGTPRPGYPPAEDR